MQNRFTRANPVTPYVTVRDPQRERWHHDRLSVLQTKWIINEKKSLWQFQKCIKGLVDAIAFNCPLWVVKCLDIAKAGLRKHGSVCVVGIGNIGALEIGLCRIWRTCVCASLQGLPSLLGEGIVNDSSALRCRRTYFVGPTFGLTFFCSILNSDFRFSSAQRHL